MDIPAIPRALLHLDVDCFFVQVEMTSDQSLRGKPVAVHQHDDIISVSYEARALGLKKHTTLAQAKEQFPSVVLVSVPKAHGSKVTYQPYQTVSSAMMEIIKRHVGACPIERASIDEFYVDVTELLQREMKGDDSSSEREEPRTGWIGKVEAAGAAPPPLCLLSSTEMALFHAGIRCAAIRAEIERSLHLKVSAGIATSKALAKIASSRSKPNGQTTILLSAVPRLLSEMPVSAYPHVKRYLGAEELAAAQREGVVLGSLIGISRAELAAKWGEKAATFLYDALRGVDSTPVVQAKPQKTLMSSMSLTPISTIKEASRAFGYIAKELSQRLFRDSLTNNRHPQSIAFHYRFLECKEVAKVLSTRAIKPSVQADPARFASSLGEAVTEVFEIEARKQADGWALRWCALIAGNFVDIATNGVDRLFAMAKTKRSDTAAADEEGECPFCERTFRTTELQLHVEEHMHSIDRQVPERGAEMGDGGTEKKKPRQPEPRAPEERPSAKSRGTLLAYFKPPPSSSSK